MNKQRYFLTDAHKTGLGNKFVQGENFHTAKPTTIASRLTNKAESLYPKVNLRLHP